MPATESRVPAQGGPHTVEGFRTDVLRIIEAYPHQPVFPLFVRLRELRERALKAIERRNPAERSQQLLHTTGLICAAMTNAAFDQGQSSAAEGQARTAHHCAELAGDRALRCWIRGTEALIAYWDERYQDAVDLAADGRRFVPGSGTALVRLAAVEARAHAHLGDAAAAEQALARASLARAEVGGPDEPGGLMEFPLPKQQAYAATTELWLGGRDRVARAERAAAEAIGGYLRAPADQRRIGELCLARLDLARCASPRTTSTARASRSARCSPQLRDAAPRKLCGGCGSWSARCTAPGTSRPPRRSNCASASGPSARRGVSHRWSTSPYEGSTTASVRA